MAVAELEDIDLDVEMTDVPKGYELIDGKLTEVPDMGAEASWVATLVNNKLTRFLENNPIGVSVTAEFSFQCFAEKPKQVRKPDVAVILCDPATFRAPRVNYLEAPDLIVEVLSPSNGMSNIADRLDDFFAAGTRLAWIIDPELRYAMIQHPDDSIQKIREAGSLTGEDVLPGFTLPLAAILPKKA